MVGVTIHVLTVVSACPNRGVEVVWGIVRVVELRIRMRGHVRPDGDCVPKDHRAPYSTFALDVCI